jgi:putative redox protein
MKVRLVQQSKFRFKATGESGHSIEMDGGENIGGENKAMRPMETVLAALGGCSGIDVVMFLEKGKQKPTSIEVEIEGNREEGAVPAVYTSINVVFKVTGEVEVEKLKRAVQLSMEKYCSVSKMLEANVKINHEAFLDGVAV